MVRYPSTLSAVSAVTTSWCAGWSLWLAFFFVAVFSAAGSVAAAGGSSPPPPFTARHGGGTRDVEV